MERLQLFHPQLLTSRFPRPPFSVFKFSTIQVFVQLGFNQINRKGSIGFGDRAEEISFHTNQTYQSKQLCRYCSCSLTSLPSCTVRIMKPNRKFSGHFPVTQKTPGSKSVTNTLEQNVTSCKKYFKTDPSSSLSTLSTSTPRMRVLVIFCALVSIAIAGEDDTDVDSVWELQ